MLTAYTGLAVAVVRSSHSSQHILTFTSMPFGTHRHPVCPVAVLLSVAFAQFVQFFSLIVFLFSLSLCHSDRQHSHSLSYKSSFTHRFSGSSRSN